MTKIMDPETNGEMRIPNVEAIHDYTDAINTQLVHSMVMDPTDRQIVIASAVTETPVLLLGDAGLGKTELAKAMAKILGGHHERIQFTYDVRPQDITGGLIWNQAENKYEFRPGPIFTNVLHADEINRGAPKTQSALLQGMQERQVTIDRATYELPRPFWVVATENPDDYDEATTALPKGNIDRFGVSIALPPQSVDTMLDVVEHQGKVPKQIFDLKKLAEIQAEIGYVGIEKSVMRRVAARIVELRGLKDLVDPRGTILSGTRPLLNIIKLSQAYAAAQKATSVTDAHVDVVAPYVLSHRIGLTHEAVEDKNISPQQLVKEVFKR